MPRNVGQPTILEIIVYSIIEDERPKACHMNISHTGDHQDCGAEANYWYIHVYDGSICSYCTKHNYVCGEELTATNLIKYLSEKLNDCPTEQDVLSFFGVDPRKDKPWPEEEDCPGCDLHKDGPHRFGCTIYGKNQLVLHMNLKDEK